MTPRWVIGLCLICVSPSAVVAEDALVTRVREGHRAARESIRTLTATITVDQIQPNQQALNRGRYWRSGNKARIQDGREGVHTEDLLMSNGELRHVGRHWVDNKTTLTAVARRYPGTEMFGSCDAWREMLIEMTGPEGGQLDLDRMLETTDGPVKADHDTLDGRACIRLRYSHTYRNGLKERATQWHDIGRNYLICKVLVEYPDSPTSSRGIMQVKDYIEPSPGVVFPIRVQRDHYRNGELSSATVTTLSDVVVNQPVSAAALALPALPPGTVLKDYIDNKEGPIDSDWKPLGPMKPLAPRPVPPVEKAPTAQPTETAPSTAEPVSSARWVIAGSVAVLLVAVLLAVARRVRLRRFAA